MQLSLNSDGSAGMFFLQENPPPPANKLGAAKRPLSTGIPRQAGTTIRAAKASTASRQSDFQAIRNAVRQTRREPALFLIPRHLWYKASQISFQASQYESWFLYHHGRAVLFVIGG
jgi:hypothetical protein